MPPSTPTKQETDMEAKEEINCMDDPDDREHIHNLESQIQSLQSSLAASIGREARLRTALENIYNLTQEIERPPCSIPCMIETEAFFTLESALSCTSASREATEPKPSEDLKLKAMEEVVEAARGICYLGSQKAPADLMDALSRYDSIVKEGK